MFGDYHYNEVLYKVNAIFGDLFNGINVARKKKDGTFTNQKQVPIEFGERHKFLERIDAEPDFESTRTAIALPRMAWTTEGPIYDSARQTSKLRKCVVEGTNGDRSIMSPAPYIVPFELSLMTKTMDDAHQIIEQILPYFQPSLGIRYRPLDDLPSQIDDVKIRLISVSKEADFEGDLTSRRVIIHTLQFDVQIYLYGAVKEEDNVIKKAVVTFSDYDDGNALVQITQDVDPETAEIGDAHTVVTTVEYGLL